MYKNIFFTLSLLLLLITSFIRGTQCFAQILPPSFEPLPPHVIENFRRRANSLYKQAEHRRQEYERLARYRDVLTLGKQFDSASLSYQKTVVTQLQDSIPRYQAQYERSVAMLQGYRNRAISLSDSVKKIQRRSVARKNEALFRRMIFSDSFLANSMPGNTIVAFPIYQQYAEKISQRGDSLSANDSLLALQTEQLLSECNADADSLQTLISLRERELTISKKILHTLTLSSSALQKSSQERQEQILQDIVSFLPIVKKEETRLTEEAQALDSTAASYEAIVHRFWAPLREYNDAEKFWGRPSLLGNISYNWSGKTLDVFLYSDYIGPVRVGSTINVSLDTSATNVAVYRRRFYQSGGDIVLHGTYLAALTRSEYHTFAVQLLTKFAINRIFTDQYRTFNLDPGIEFYGTAKPFGWIKLFGSPLDFISVYGFFRLGSGIGLHENFYRSTMGYEAKPFIYGQVVGGIQLWSVRLLWVGSPFAPTGLRQPLLLNNFIIQVTVPR